VVVHDLYVECVTVYETKAYPPLIIDRDRMLTFSIAPERMQAVARRDSQILQLLREVQILETAY